MGAVTLPDGPSIPRAVQGFFAVTARLWVMRRMRERYGSAFTLNLPMLGKAVVLADPGEIKQLLATSPEIADNVDVNLGRVLGADSIFAVSGAPHRRLRKILAPPFHGRRVRAYEAIVEEEAAREMASWPEGRDFPTLASMRRITLNVITRTVFGAEGAELIALRRLLPAAVNLGSRLAYLPLPRTDLGWWSPWGRLRIYRERCDEIIDRLIVTARQDPDLGKREDVLAMLLQGRYEDGSGLDNGEISGQLLTLLAAGNETTAASLAWAVERLRRHPAVLRRLTDEADAGGSRLREATIFEVQRVRPVVDQTARQVRAPSMRLGRWTLQRGQVVFANIYLLHDNDDVFSNARDFDPDRFVDSKPGRYDWIPFGGGARRCLGASFAHMEMDVILRTLLRNFTLEPTDERGERRRSRGISFVPAKGGRAKVTRRTTP